MKYELLRIHDFSLSTIWSVLHLLDNSGTLMPYILFSSKFNLDVKEQYQKGIKAVTEPVTSVYYNLNHNNISPKFLEFLLKGHSVINKKVVQ